MRGGDDPEPIPVRDAGGRQMAPSWCGPSCSSPRIKVGEQHRLMRPSCHHQSCSVRCTARLQARNLVVGEVHLGAATAWPPLPSVVGLHRALESEPQRLAALVRVDAPLVR
jgi:hypothetical protein